MSKRKLLLTNCGHSEIPLIVAARHMGWQIITTGLNHNGIGHILADKTVLGDFSDKDFIYNLAKKEKVDAIVSGCEDAAYLSAAYACDKLGLPGHDSYEVAKIIHNKMKFRNVMRTLRLPTPTFCLCKSINEAVIASREISFPLVVKAPDRNSGIGINICRSIIDLESAVIKSLSVTDCDYVLLEKYIEGTRHAANVIFEKQRIIKSFFDDEQYYLNPYLVAGASSPSGLYHYTMIQVIKQLESIAKHLNLCDGMFHVQFIVDKNGIPFLIDPCRRIPGGLYLLLIRYSGGYDCAECVIRAETGENEICPDDRWGRRFIGREYIMSNTCGTIKNITIDSDIKEKIVDHFIWGKSGDVITNPLTYKAGIIFMEFENYHEMKEVVNNFNNFIRIEVE